MSPSRPGETWRGFGNLESGPGSLREQIQTVLSKVDFQHLQKVALRTRLTQDETADPDISCIIDPSTFTHEFNNVVLEVSFSDHVYWIAKIQYTSVDASKASSNTMDIKSELATMRTVKARTNIPVPQVFSYNVSPSNEAANCLESSI